jgi:hypothetical protein
MLRGSLKIMCSRHKLGCKVYYVDNIIYMSWIEEFSKLIINLLNKTFNGS